MKRKSILLSCWLIRSILSNATDKSYRLKGNSSSMIIPIQTIHSSFKSGTSLPLPLPPSPPPLPLPPLPSFLHLPITLYQALPPPFLFPLPPQTRSTIKPTRKHPSNQPVGFPPPTVRLLLLLLRGMAIWK